MSNHLESISLCELISIARNEVEKSQAKLKESKKEPMLSLGKIQIESHFVISKKEGVGGKGEIGLEFFPIKAGAGVSKETVRQNESLNKIIIELMPYKSGGGPRGGEKSPKTLPPVPSPSGGGVSIIKDNEAEFFDKLERLMKVIGDKVEEKEKKRDDIPVAVDDNNIMFTKNGDFLCNENTYYYLVESSTLQDTEYEEYEFQPFSDLDRHKQIELLDYSIKSNIKFDTDKVGLLMVKTYQYQYA